MKRKKSKNLVIGLRFRLPGILFFTFYLLTFAFTNMAFAQGGGNALDFDGTNDYVTRTYDSDFDFGTGSFTVSGWFKTAGSPGGGSATADVSVTASADDGHESPAGAVNLGYHRLDIGAYHVGTRFLNVNIPDAALITNAYVTFYAKSGSSGSTSCNIYAEDSATPATFSTASNNISSRIKTSASVAWSPGAWTGGSAYNTPDISSVIQELVDTYSGITNIAIITDIGTGIREGTDYDNGSYPAPALHVEYSTGTQFVVSRYDTDQGFKIWLSGNGKLSFGIDDDASWSPDTEAMSSSAYDDNVWHHFASVKDGNTALRLYVDGSEVASNTSLEPSGQVSVRVSGSADDAEEPASGGYVDTGSSDLELINDGDDQQVGMRFNSITIPQGATISSAYIQFTADSSPGNDVPTGFDLTFYAEATDDALAFSSDNYDITGRDKTSGATWTDVPTWTGGLTYNTDDISTVIQAVVDRDGWSNGNSIAIIVTGETGGTRNAESYNGNADKAPFLVVDYTTTLGTLTSDSAPLTFGSDEPTNANYFDGIIEELRVWNTARSQTQIQANMFKQIDGGTSGLKGYWQFNESPVTTNANDETANNNDGTLTNMAGTEWTSSTAPIASSTTSDKTDLNAVWVADNANTSSIMTITDSNISDTNCIIFGHDNGGLSANTSDVPGTINRRLNRVWRLEEYGTLTGSIAFDCTDLGITEGSDLRLLVDSDGTFTDAPIVEGSYSAPNFTVSTHAFQNGFYYTLASTSADNSLPVTLSSFTVQFLDNAPILCWVTQSETNNAGWNIYRGETSEALSNEEAYLLNLSLGLIPGAGTTSEPTDYSFEDVFPVYQGNTYFYWLESMDYSGETELYGPISLTIPEDEWQNPNSPEIPKPYGLHQNYPNPFNPNTEISFMMKENCIGELSIFNIKGQKIKTIFNNSSISRDELIISIWNGKDESGIEVSTGVYLYELKTNKEIYLKRMLLIK